MRILQQHVDFIEYEPLEKEFAYAEETEKKKRRFENALVLFTSVEEGDSDETAKRAVDEAYEFAKKMKIKGIVIYPFVHLTSNPEGPAKALALLKKMEAEAKAKGIEVHRAPFGWNKQFELRIKGHPLAEQSRSYGSSAKAQAKRPKAAKINTAIVKKSDWAGLPENDHRTIGEKLDLYSFQEVSPAMVYWHPKGFTVYRQLVGFIRDKEEEYGYEELSTPGLANVALWHMSGHDEHYKENMFTFESQLGEIGLKPMNCPSTILIYKSKRWSYRDLPFRTAIFDRLYRSELSGAVTGLFRVKELTQDDGHVFLREDQVDKELDSLLRMVKEIYDTFGLKFAPKLSTMPDDHSGEKAEWEKATAQLKKALDDHKMKYEVKEKEGSFYAPKIDFDIFDSQGRAWQCGTIQLDYQMPKKFGLEYTGEDGKAHMPVMIHRAILGSLERFIGILVEHYQGKFPTWLSPVQVKVISISDQSNEYAHKVYEQLRKAKIRADEDIGDRTMEYKLREAIGQKVPYMLVVGQKEVDAGTVAVRTRSGGQKFGVKLDDFIGKMRVETEKRLSGPN